METRGIIGQGRTGTAGVLLQGLGQNGHQRHLFGTARGDGRRVQETAFFLDLGRQTSTQKAAVLVCALGSTFNTISSHLTLSLVAHGGKETQTLPEENSSAAFAWQ